MKISVDSNSIIIEGNIKSLTEVREINSAMEQLSKGTKEIKLVLKDSLSFPSSLIGYLIKAIKQNGIKISVLIKDSRVYETLSDLGMIELFNVKKI